MSEIDLVSALPRILPRAIAWVEASAAEAYASGRQLGDEESALARSVGVCHPELIRLTMVRAFPGPSDPELRAAAHQTGLLGPQLAGLTLGHAVLVRRGVDDRVLRHEFRHVYQYETAGSIAAFLGEYLPQIARFGYAGAPYELDARAWEGEGEG